MNSRLRCKIDGPMFKPWVRNTDILELTQCLIEIRSQVSGCFNSIIIIYGVYRDSQFVLHELFINRVRDF